MKVQVSAARGWRLFVCRVSSANHSHCRAEGRGQRTEPQRVLSGLDAGVDGVGGLVEQAAALLLHLVGRLLGRLLRVAGAARDGVGGFLRDGLVALCGGWRQQRSWLARGCEKEEGLPGCTFFATSSAVLCTVSCAFSSVDFSLSGFRFSFTLSLASWGLVRSASVARHRRGGEAVLQDVSHDSGSR